MMARNKTCVAIFLLIGMIVQGSTFASSELDDTLQQNIRFLKDANWEVRAKAFNYLQDYTDKEEVKAALIELLEFENKQNESWFQKYLKDKTIKPLHGEGYYPDLVEVVASFKDPRSIPALIVGAFNAKAARETISELGVKPDMLQSAMKSTCRPEVRIGIAGIIRQTLKMNELSVLDKQVLEQVLLAGLNDSSPTVRTQFVYTTGEINAQDLLPELQKIMSQDPYSLKRATDGKTVFYPVREEAEKAIIKLKAADYLKK